MFSLKFFSSESAPGRYTLYRTPIRLRFHTIVRSVQTDLSNAYSKRITVYGIPTGKLVATRNINNNNW